MVKGLPGESDGRMTDAHSILISSRLYNQLPTLDINNLQGNEKFQLIVRTLFHELCHISEITTMPKIHRYSFSHKNIGYMIALFWIEYIVERKTCAKINSQIDELCIDAAENDWSISKLNFTDADCSNYFYLTKVLAYVIARVRATGEMTIYLKTIRNPIVKSMIYELNKEVTHLEVLYPFDNMEILNEIKRLFEKYWESFKKRKSFISAFPSE